MRRLTPVLAAIALCSLLLGCGGDNEAANDYVESVNQTQNEFARTFDELSSQITAKSTPEQDQETLDGFRAAVDKAVKDLRAVEVPGDVRDLHDRLIREISSYGTEIEKAKKAFDDPKETVAAQTDLVKAVTRISGQINGTIDAINQKLRE